MLNMRLLCLSLLAALSGTALGIAEKPPSDSPEARAVQFLVREVPRWSAQNKCFSCHNNGDGARALYRAVQHDYEVPATALAATDEWLLRPGQWSQELEDAEFKDERLARIQFAATLIEAVNGARRENDAGGQTRLKQALLEAAALVARDQDKAGSWPLITGGAVAAPATYGPILATHFARRVLRASGDSRYRSELLRSQRWLEQAPMDSVMDAAAVLLSLNDAEGSAAASQRARAIQLLRRAQSAGGGWGPFPNSVPEPFDTALALIALAETKDRNLNDVIARGRAFLIARQQPEGSWPATTRPAGVDSYAQYISTSAWALQALLATSRSREP